MSAPSLPALREDTHGVIPYAGGRSLSLYQIESELAELLDLREDVESNSPGEQETLAEIDKQIAEYFSREVRKVNGIANAIHGYEAAAREARDEAARIAKRAATFEAIVDRIKRSTLDAMQAHQVKKHETPTNSLRIQANGGKAPLLIEGLVPEAYSRVTVTMPAETWDQISAKCADTLIGFPHFEPDTEKIRAALALTVVCPECNGGGHDRFAIKAEESVCPRCGGRGTIPQTVPGARIGERGVHLRIS